MTHRERFLATLHYQPIDRLPLYDFNYWDETIPAWHEQGLPNKYNRGNAHQYFGLDASLGGGNQPWHWGWSCGLMPGFERHILKEEGDIQTVMQSDGVIVQQSKSSVSIPAHVGHTLTDRQSWKEHYLPKLDPDTPSRCPADWDARLVELKDTSREHPALCDGGSLFGRLRDWMGLENISMVVYDDPAWFEEMVETCCQLICEVIKKSLDAGARFDACAMWEDMCYNAGPLLSPTHFREFLLPRYRRIADLLRAHGTDIIWVDCDGKIDDLIPLWLEAGINCMFPVEIGNWADPIKLRQRFGQDLIMMGGFDKHILAQSPDAIDAEIARLTPLVEEGGFIPFCDHRVPPDVPLKNYLHYCQRIREVWGAGVELEPMEAV